MTTTMLASAGNTGASTGVIVGGAVGGVIVVLLLLLLIVVLLVFILAKNRSKKTRYNYVFIGWSKMKVICICRLTESEVTYTTTGGVRIVDNEIYGE